MSDLRTLFNTNNKIIQKSEVGNYFPPKIYADANKIKYQKEKAKKKYVKDPPKKKLDLKCKKGTFLQQIQKRESKLPSPHSYKPAEYEPSFKKRKLSNLPGRCTIFQVLNKQNKNNPTPSPSQYNNEKQKSISMGKFDKSHNTNYLDGVVCQSSILPGVGQYFLRSNSLDKLGKWDKAEKSMSNKQNKMPTSTTYTPLHPDMQLFSQFSKTKLKISKFDKQKRFTETSQKNSNKNLFYTGISEWGMRTNYQKKDILSNLSNHNNYSKSVYYG